MLPEIKKILYTTNLHDDTRSVLRFAVSLAKRHGAKLTLLHVVQPLSDAGRFMVEAYLSEAMADQLRTDVPQHVLDKIRSRLERFCTDELKTSLDQLDFIGEIKVIPGTPSEVIAREAEALGVDLIVAGRGYGSALRHLFLGSTAHRVTLISRKPVLIVPVLEETSWGD
jgi:nucleotide-binding universal stress UspA family protein